MTTSRCAFVLLILAGCDSSEETGVTGDGTSGGANGTSGAGGSGLSSSSGGASVGGFASGGMTNGTGGTSAGACGLNEATLSSGAQTTQHYVLQDMPSGTHGRGWSGWSYDGDVGDSGWFILSGPEKVMSLMGLPFALNDGQTIAVTRAFLAPNATATALGTTLCVGADSGSTMTRSGRQLLLDLKQVTTGACTDHPIQGEINLCLEYAGCGANFDGGSVEGHAWTSQPSSYAAGYASMQADLTGDAVFVKSTNTGAAVNWALILTSPSGPFAGEVLCAGPGSQIVDANAMTHSVWQLRNLGSFGACLGGTGAVTGCLQGG